MIGVIDKLSILEIVSIMLSNKGDGFISDETVYYVAYALTG